MHKDNLWKLYMKIARKLTEESAISPESRSDAH